MTIDLKKLASTAQTASRFMGEDEKILLGAAIETVVLEKQAGRLEDIGIVDEEGIVLLGASVVDEIVSKRRT